MDVTVRKATHDDYEAVMAINDNIYDGQDYLVPDYHRLLSCQNYEGFLCELNGEVIGFNMGCLVDDKRTVIVRAGRVMSSHQGKGVYRKLLDYLFAWYAGKPDVRVEAMTTHDLVVSKYEHKFETAYNKILDRNTPQFTLNIADFNHKKFVLEDNGGLKNVDEELLKNIFSRPNLCNAWFPEKRLVSSWVPYRLLASNIPYILHHADKIICDPDVCRDVDAQHNSGLMTIGRGVACAKSFVYDIDIMGKGSKSLSAHILAHLRHVNELTTGEASIKLFAEKTFPMEELKETMSKYGIVQSESYFSSMYLFERNINKL